MEWIALIASLVSLAVSVLAYRAVGKLRTTFLSRNVWTKPSGCEKVYIEMWGAGGGGGSPTPPTSPQDPAT